MLKKGFLVPLVLAILCVFLSACFVFLDTVPLAHDDINHFRHSLDYREIMTGEGAFPEKVRDLAAYENPFPPLLFFLTALLFLITGPSVKAALFVNILLIPVFILALYALVRKLAPAESNTFSLLAAVCGLSFPLVYVMSRLYYLDFALLVCVTAAYAFFFHSESLQKRGYAILFGLSSGLALLCKWTAVLFLAGAFIYLLIECLRSRRPGLFSRLLLTVALALLLSGWWYGLHYSGITGRYGVAVAQHGPGRLFTMKPEPFVYLRYLFYSVGPCFWPFILFGIVLALKKKRAYVLPLALWLIIPYLALTMVPAKLPRYLLPALPVLAVPLLEFGGLKKEGRRKWIAGFLVLISLVSVTSITFFSGSDVSCLGFSPPPKLLLLDSQRSGFSIDRTVNHEIYRDILEAVMEDGNAVKSLAVVPYAGHLLTKEILKYQASLAGLEESLFIMSPYELPGDIRPLTLLDANYYLLTPGRQFYLEEGRTMPELEGYLEAVTAFLLAHREDCLETLAVFELAGMRFQLLALRKEWEKNDIQDYFRRIQEILPSSFYLARGIRRISGDKLFVVLPKAELLLYPDVPGGRLSIACELPPAPYHAGPASAVFLAGGRKIFEKTMDAGRQYEFTLDLAAEPQEAPQKFSIQVRAHAREKPVPHRIRPAARLILKDIRYNER